MTTEMRMKFFDNTRISAYRKCPRMFYFRHVRDWRLKGTAAPLVFGSSWHSAMDVVWRLAKEPMSDMELARSAHDAFMAKWVEEGFPSMREWDLAKEELFAPRTPGIAMDMLMAYIALRRQQIQRLTVLAIERPFAVPLDASNANIMLVGRRDKDVQTEDGHIGSYEHKTTTEYKKDGPFKSNYIESFSPNSQVDGYTHALHMDYGDAVRGVWVDAALVHKKERGFKIIPVMRHLNMLDAWLFETTNWINKILEDTDSYFSKKSESGWMGEKFMAAFPKNTDSCIQFNRPCPYIDLCKAYANPEQVEEPPEGYIVEKWEPFKELDLQKIGLQDEEV